MVSASVQVIYQSVESLMSDVQAFSGNITDLRKIDMGPLPITVMSVTVGMFFLLTSVIGIGALTESCIYSL